MRHAGVHDVEGGDRGRCVRADNCRRLARRRQGVDVLSPLPVALGHLRNRLGIGVLRDWSICSWWNRLFCMTPSRPARERSPEWLLVGNDRGGEAAASPALRTFRGTVTFWDMAARFGRVVGAHSVDVIVTRLEGSGCSGGRLGAAPAGQVDTEGETVLETLSKLLSFHRAGRAGSVGAPLTHRDTLAATQIDESFFPRPPVDESSEMPEHAVKPSRRPGNRVVEIPRQSAWQAAALGRTS